MLSRTVCDPGNSQAEEKQDAAASAASLVLIWPGMTDYRVDMSGGERTEN